LYRVTGFYLPPTTFPILRRHGRGTQTAQRAILSVLGRAYHSHFSSASRIRELYSLSDAFGSCAGYRRYDNREKCRMSPPADFPRSTLLWGAEPTRRPGSVIGRLPAARSGRAIRGAPPGAVPVTARHAATRRFRLPAQAVGSLRLQGHATVVLCGLVSGRRIPIGGLDKAGGPGVVFRALGGAAAEGHGCSRRQHGLPGSAGSVAACRRHDLRSDASKRTVAHQDVFLCRKRSSREHRAQSLHRAFPGPVRKNTWEHGRCRPWNGIWSRWWWWPSWG
jgi:hypothetical protein